MSQVAAFPTVSRTFLHYLWQPGIAPAQTATIPKEISVHSVLNIARPAPALAVAIRVLQGMFWKTLNVFIISISRKVPGSVTKWLMTSDFLTMEHIRCSVLVRTQLLLHLSNSVSAQVLFTQTQWL